MPAAEVVKTQQEGENKDVKEQEQVQESSSSSAQTDSGDRTEVLKKADDLIAQGKRNMVCGEVPKAVNVFEEAVKLLVKNCGEMSRDCADAYFHCGSALLELCRMESNVLGSALDGVDVEEEKEEKETEQFEKPPADDDEGDTAEEDGEGDTAEEDEGDAEEEKEEDDVGHFQLAWEYLDVAKVIYSKKEEKDDQLKASECLLKLGELSMENEQYETSATDLLSALAIQKKYLKEDDRTIAETHFQLGLAYGLGKEFEKAIEQYQNAITVIEAKIVSLNKFIEEKEGGDSANKENSETDDLMKYKKEVKELQELIPEMKNKVEDMKVEQKDVDKMKEAAKEMLGMSGTTKGFGSPTKKGASNGSSSVDENGEAKALPIGIRKKRKPEDEAPSTVQELKKIRQEESKVNGVNGDVKVNGNAEINGNGVTEDKKSESAAAPVAEPMTS